MALTNTCPFLRLPQELRDQIYSHAFRSYVYTVSSAEDVAHLLDVAPIPGVLWKIETATRAPIVPYLSLMLCCRQLCRETKTFLNYSPHDPEDSTAKLTLALAYPNAHACWSCVPRPPHQLRVLEMTVEMGNIFHPSSSGPRLRDMNLRLVFEVLKRYIHFGPHLARSSQLRQPLTLQIVRITIISATPVEDMTFVYDNPARQLAMLAGRMKHLMEKLACSGLLVGAVDVLEMRLQEEEWTRMPVTDNVWDEQDYVLLRNLGFRWGGE